MRLCVLHKQQAQLTREHWKGMIGMGLHIFIHNTYLSRKEQIMRKILI